MFLDHQSVVGTILLLDDDFLFVAGLQRMEQAMAVIFAHRKSRRRGIFW